MEVVNLTCVECPVGCSINVTVDGGKAIKVEGNGCARGKLYAENEVVCPKRVVTSTVKTTDGRLLPVKTDIPVRKSAMFEVMGLINAVVVAPPVSVGDVLVDDIFEGARLVATGNAPTK